MSSPADLADDRRIWVVLLVLVTVPLWFTAIPPLLDLPGHMGRYRIMTAGPLPSLAGYEFRWALVGNLGADLLIVPLSALVGVEAGTWLITALTLALMAAAVLQLSRQVHGRVEPGALFALALLYSYPFQLGLINYWLGAALALFALGLWLRMADGWRRGLLFAGIAVALWVVHVAAWGVFGLMAFGSEAARRHQRGQPLLRAVMGAALACLPLALPLVIMAVQVRSAVGPTENWFDWPQKRMLVLSLFRDRWLLADVASAAVIAVLLLAALAALLMPAQRRPLRLAPVLVWPALLTGAAFVILPPLLIGSYYADVRLLPIAVMLGLLAIGTRDEALRPVLILAGLLFLSVRLALTSASFVLYDAAYRRELAALAALPQGASVLVLTGSDCWEDWYRSRLDHVGSLATVRRDAFTNDQFIGPGAQLLKVIKPGIGPFVATPSQTILPRHCPHRPPDATDAARALASFNRTAFDHVWLINVPGVAPPADLERLWTNGGSALYRVTTTDSRTRRAAAAAAAQRPNG